MWLTTLIFIDDFLFALLGFMIGKAMLEFSRTAGLVRTFGVEISLNLEGLDLDVISWMKMISAYSDQLAMILVLT